VSLELLAQKGSREILYTLFGKKGMKFTELKELVGSPTTTSRRLQELMDLGLIKRDVQADQYRTVIYSLTEKGIKIVRLVKELEHSL
jgi:DNA-binding HxlR family transcriptional regulator